MSDRDKIAGVLQARHDTRKALTAKLATSQPSTTTDRALMSWTPGNSKAARN